MTVQLGPLALRPFATPSLRVPAQVPTGSRNKSHQPRVQRSATLGNRPRAQQVPSGRPQTSPGCSEAQPWEHPPAPATSPKRDDPKSAQGGAKRNPGNNTRAQQQVPSGRPQTSPGCSEAQPWETTVRPTTSPNGTTPNQPRVQRRQPWEQPPAPATSPNGTTPNQPRVQRSATLGNNRPTLTGSPSQSRAQSTESAKRAISATRESPG